MSLRPTASAPPAGVGASLPATSSSVLGDGVAGAGSFPADAQADLESGQGRRGARSARLLAAKRPLECRARRFAQRICVPFVGLPPEPPPADPDSDPDSDDEGLDDDVEDTFEVRRQETPPCPQVQPRLVFLVTRVYPIVFLPIIGIMLPQAPRARRMSRVTCPAVSRATQRFPVPVPAIPTPSLRSKSTRPPHLTSRCPHTTH